MIYAHALQRMDLLTYNKLSCRIHLMHSSSLCIWPRDWEWLLIRRVNTAVDGAGAAGRFSVTVSWV